MLAWILANGLKRYGCLYKDTHDLLGHASIERRAARSAIAIGSGAKWHAPLSLRFSMCDINSGCFEYLEKVKGNILGIAVVAKSERCGVERAASGLFVVVG